MNPCKARKHSIDEERISRPSRIVDFTSSLPTDDAFRTSLLFPRLAERFSILVTDETPSQPKCRRNEGKDPNGEGNLSSFSFGAPVLNAFKNVKEIDTLKNTSELCKTKAIDSHTKVVQSGNFLVSTADDAGSRLTNVQQDRNASALTSSLDESSAASKLDSGILPERRIIPDSSACRTDHGRDGAGTPLHSSISPSRQHENDTKKSRAHIDSESSRTHVLGSQDHLNPPVTPQMRYGFVQEDSPTLGAGDISRLVREHLSDSPTHSRAQSTQSIAPPPSDGIRGNGTVWDSERSSERSSTAAEKDYTRHTEDNNNQVSTLYGTHSRSTSQDSGSMRIISTTPFTIVIPKPFNDGCKASPVEPVPSMITPEIERTSWETDDEPKTPAVEHLQAPFEEKMPQWSPDKMAKVPSMKAASKTSFPSLSRSKSEEMLAMLNTSPLEVIPEDHIATPTNTAETFKSFPFPGMSTPTIKQSQFSQAHLSSPPPSKQHSSPKKSHSPRTSVRSSSSSCSTPDLSRDFIFQPSNLPFQAEVVSPPVKKKINKKLIGDPVLISSSDRSIATRPIERVVSPNRKLDLLHRTRVALPKS